MSNKLHIPGSADGEDFTELNMVLVLGWAVCMLLCIGLFLFFRERRPEPLPGSAVAEAGAQEESKTALEETVEIFRFGPLESAESACLKLRPKLASGELAAEVDLELLKVLERRANFAPWTCLMSAYLEDELSEELQIHDELAKFWRQAQTFYVSPEPVALMLRGFYLGESTPDTPEFTRWLRLCGMTPSFGARPACMQLMRRSAPSQGSDVLEMVERHLEITDAKTLALDMPRVAKGLGNFSADGQPSTWMISETDAIENYNRDLRVGAAFMLCRIVNSPDEKAAGAAALGLAKAANMGARAADTKLARRWRETCQLAFHLEDEGQDEPSEKEAAEEKLADENVVAKDQNIAKIDDATLEQRLDKSTPTPTGTHVLAVWNGEENSPPDYTLRGAIERGGCSKEAGRPAWYCGLRYWRGGTQKPFDLSLQDLFTKTSYIEWLEE